MVARARTKLKPHRPAILLCATLLLILTAAAYWNSFDVPLVFDDLLTIQANSGVQFGDNLQLSLWTTRPILYLTFAINHSLHGQRVFGYHAVNFALHVLNAVLVFLIALQIFRRFESTENSARTYALLAAAFFAVHPLQTEAVTYISSRSELLSTAFYALAILMFALRDERKIGFLWSFAVAIPFGLGLFTKETVVSLPFALLAYDFFILSGATTRGILSRWRFYAPFVAGGIVATYFLVTAVLVGAIGPEASHITPWNYLLTQSRVIVTYIRLLVFPVGQNLDYDFRVSASLFEPSIIGSLVVLSGLLFLAWRLRRRRPIAAFSIAWFFITLAPTSSFIPLPDVIFEHRLYLPLIGVSLSFPLLIGFAASLLQSKITVPVPAVCVALLLMLCIATILRNQVWGDEVRLWSDVVEKSPHKARPYNSLATIYFNRSQFDLALDVTQQGWQNVDDANSRRGFQQLKGQIYIQMHRYEDAVAAFRETAKVEDKYLASTAYNNIGVAYAYIAGTKSGELKQALLTDAAEAFRKSSDLDDRMFSAFDSYVNVLVESGQSDDLKNKLQSMLQEKKDYRAYYGLGKIAFLSGDYEKAAHYFDEALRLNGSQKLIFFNDAYALNLIKKRDDAIQKYLQAIRLDPLFTPARHNLGLLYMQAGEPGKAIDSFENVLRLDPNYLSARLNLAKIYIQQGNRSAARDQLSKVLSVAPQHQEAADLLRQLGS